MRLLIGPRVQPAVDAGLHPRCDLERGGGTERKEARTKTNKEQATGRDVEHRQRDHVEQQGRTKVVHGDQQHERCAGDDQQR